MEPTTQQLVKITTQYRSKRGMVYELQHGDTTLVVQITPGQASSQDGQWHVEAKNAKDPAHPGANAWGATREDALREAGRTWIAPPAVDRRTFDWDAVALALRAVRAL